MENTKTKKGSEGSKLKERHIVSWSQEEDDILREQIRVHGTENWSIIASKFKDKTTRQCRRRWFTYLNSDFKKGGWSPEEDMLLCEAQKIYGNRWTEIAKVVSGRTDNAVKNRFTTLCKKRAKQEALTKENKNSYINSNNKRVIFPNGFGASGILESLVPAKKSRMTIIDVTENGNPVERLARDCGRTENQNPRLPLAVLTQNFNDVANLSSQDEVSISKGAANDVSNKAQGTFLKKDDPRMLALIQQAELLGSLAVKVNTDSTQQTLENAWKVLQDFLGQNKESNMIANISDMDLQLENFKDLLEELSSNEGSQLSWRQPDLYEESPGSSEYSTGSTVLSQTAADKVEQSQGEQCSSHQGNVAESQSTLVEDQQGIGGLETGILSAPATNQVMLPSCDDLKDHDEILSPFSITEFTSPVQVTPIFRSLAAGVPSPKFSESERQFLLKTLGVESPSCNPSNNTDQPPPCKRSLLQSL